MRIHIVGTGGVGGYYGGLLAKNGADVKIICRPNKLHLFKNGLTVIDYDKSKFTISPDHITDSYASVKNSNLILLSVKSYHLDEVCKSLADHIPVGCKIITLQNGVEADMIVQKNLPKANVLAGTIWMLATMDASGLVTQLSPKPPLKFGSRNANDDSLIQIQNELIKYGINAHYSKHIARDLWDKYIWLCAFSGLAGSRRITMGEIANNPTHSKVFLQAIEEAIALSNKLNIGVDANTNQKSKEKLENYKTSNTNAKPSLLIDLENGKTTEIKFLSGTIVRLAKEVGLSVPTHEEFVSVISKNA